MIKSTGITTIVTFCTGQFIVPHSVYGTFNTSCYSWAKKKLNSTKIKNFMSDFESLDA